MLSYDKFCNKLDDVSISNFGVPVQRLLKQKLFNYFVNEDEEIFDIVMEEILRTNQSISYYNMYHKFEKYNNRKVQKMSEVKELKIVKGCEDKECHICDADVCEEVNNAFRKEYKLFFDKDEYQNAINRLKKQFPNIKWSYKKIKDITIDIHGKRIVSYETVGG
jgi:hypothetical protein